MGRKRVDLGQTSDERIASMLALGRGVSAVAAEFGISRATSARRIRELRGGSPVPGPEKKRALCEKCFAQPIRKWPGKLRWCHECVVESLEAKLSVPPAVCSMCGGSEGMTNAGKCWSCINQRGRPKLPSRKCASCENFTTYPTAKYCSDACRPARALKKAKNRRGQYNRADKYEVRARLIEEQGGKCAACRGDGGERGLLLDHDHQTGEPRAALCHGCNSSFGLLGESPNRIQGLLEFAIRTQQKAAA